VSSPDTYRRVGTPTGTINRVFDKDGQPSLKGIIAGEAVILPLAGVVAVQRVGRIVALPGSPPWLPGLIYFRGGIEAAIDAGRLWGQGSFQPGDSARAVLIEDSGLRGVLLFDDLQELLDIAALPFAGGELASLPHPPGTAGRLVTNPAEDHPPTALLLSSTQLLQGLMMGRKGI